MPPRVTIEAVIDAIDLPNRDWQSFLHRENGAIVTICDDMAIGPDGDEIDPAEVQDSDEFMPLPTSFEIDEWSMMEEFAQQRPQPLRDELLNGLNGRGAFRIFRGIVKRVRLEDEWYRFRHQAFASIAREWLEEHGIAYE